MIAQFWLRQGQKRRGEKHSLVIGMGYEQTDPLIPQSGESRLGDGGRVEP